MEDFLKFCRIYNHWLLLILFALLFFGFTAVLFTMDDAKHPQAASFIGGLAAAFLVATVQFLIQLLEQIKLAKFRKHGVMDFLEDRRDRNLYRKTIRTATKNTKIQILGVTCNRLLEDFANPNEKASQDLIIALNNQVTVELLVPKSKYLTPKDRSDLENKTLKSAAELKNRFPTLFCIKYFDFPPSHSIFSCGNICIVGPVFPEKSSKDTPAIIFDRSGSYVAPYLENFESTWKNADDNHV